MANGKQETKKLRVQLDFLPSRVHDMDDIMASCEFSTRKELFDNALAFFEWAVHEAQKGRDIASYDAASDHVERLLYPALAAASRNINRNLRVPQAPEDRHGKSGPLDKQRSREVKLSHFGNRKPNVSVA